MKRSQDIVSILWFYLITVAAPFYVRDQYFDLLQAKAFFCDAALLLLLCALAVMCLPALRERRLFPLPKPSPFAMAALLFGALALLSCLLSSAPAASFWGMEGWGVGGFAMAGLSLVCVLLPGRFPYRHNLWLPVLGANLLVFMFAILHAAQVDVFGLHRDILPSQWYSYLSTIGNRNWYVGYLCLLVPMAAVFFLSATQRSSEALWLLFLAPACLNLVICLSDGAYLGLGLCAFFALPYLTANARHLRRSFLLLTLYGMSLLVFRLVPAFTGMSDKAKGVSRIMLNPRVALLVTVVGLLGALLAHKCWDSVPKPWRRRITILLELGLLAVAVAFLLHTVTHFSDKWGTNRGRTWRVSLELFRSLPLGQRLLGVGPELLGLYYSDLSGSFLRPILSAHSEPLQILLTNGILGLACWGAAWGLLLWQYFRARLWERDEIALFLPLAAYFGQGLVNGPQPLNVSLLCVMIVCLRTQTAKIRPSGLVADLPVHRNA